MSVLNPRKRLVNFRLSEVEFDRLKAACGRQGARSISDFARTSVLQSIDEPRDVATLPYPRVSSVDQKVAELEIRLEQLLRLMCGGEVPPASTGSPAGVVPKGGELQQN